MSAAADAHDAPPHTVIAIAQAAIASRTTPGLQLSVRVRRSDGAWAGWDHCDGALDYDAASPRVMLATPYDLASVTKAIVALAIVRAASRGAIELEAPLARYVAESEGHPAGAASIASLLAHRAELPAWMPFYQAVLPAEAESGGTRARVITAVARTPLEPSGGAARYSDVGYILLGEAISRALGKSLPDIVRDECTAPLGIDTAVHYRGVTAAFREAHIAPTEQCAWRGRVIQGNVHDENAFALEGTSGHAGLFGTARALAGIGVASVNCLELDASWFAPASMRAMVAVRAGGSHRLGWDGKSGEASSAGTRTSTATFGHLGFTGTSLWCDPESHVVMALVTNRVHPTRANLGIRGLRIELHDAVMASLGCR